ncbi:hypothetical protein TcasGA2_TC031334 [Tribolium castaneum]|uniref:Uncharacterized protein n=1 Tax=Tribolium castaneum TaxID=7070 RepID=A0A139WB56_TRICA|nr:hypothetical protein TcasGA2_TC031334 [Tribolium castaneum]
MYSLYPLIGHILTAHVYQVVYYAQHIKFQVIMFKEHIAKLADFAAENDQEYQEKINHRLKFCIKRLQDFVAVHEMKMEQVKNMIAVFAVSCTCLGISIFFFVLSKSFGQQYYLRMAITIIAACASFVAVIWTCQSLENENDEATGDLIQAPWYNFNKKNTLLYLIFIQNAMKPRRIQFSDDLSINYEGGLRVCT